MLIFPKRLHKYFINPDQLPTDLIHSRHVRRTRQTAIVTTCVNFNPETGKAAFKLRDVYKKDHEGIFKRVDRIIYILEEHERF